jgi:hypothetical protein
METADKAPNFGYQTDVKIVNVTSQAAEALKKKLKYQARAEQRLITALDEELQRL